MLSLSGFELYSRWVPLTIQKVLNGLDEPMQFLYKYDHSLTRNLENKDLVLSFIFDLQLFI